MMLMPMPCSIMAMAEKFSRVQNTTWGGDAIPFEQLQNVIIPTETGHNELFILAVFQGIGVLVRQRMIQGEDCNHGILSQGDPVVSHAVFVAEERKVNDFGIQPLLIFVPDAFHQVDLNFGVCFGKALDDGWQPVRDDLTRCFPAILDISV